MRHTDLLRDPWNALVHVQDAKFMTEDRMYTPSGVHAITYTSEEDLAAHLELPPATSTPVRAKPFPDAWLKPRDKPLPPPMVSHSAGDAPRETAVVPGVPAPSGEERTQITAASQAAAPPAPQDSHGPEVSEESATAPLAELSMLQGRHRGFDRQAPPAPSLDTEGIKESETTRKSSTQPSPASPVTTEVLHHCS